MVVYTLEQRWEILRQIDLQKMPVLAKKKPAQETRTHILKSRGGFWSRAIFGPFFFEYKQGEAVTVLGDRYRAMLNEFLLLLYKKFSISIIIEEEDIGNIWFQEDDATCHSAEATLDVLRPVFEDRIISRRVDVVWPPRICGLTPLDYYLWVSSKVSVTPTSQR